jgi:hypothetical protein
MWPDGLRTKNTQYGFAAGPDYRLQMYLRRVNNRLLMRIKLNQNISSQEADINENTYLNFWDQLAKSNFVSSLKINAREIR